jgi:hypothetical protein
MKQLLARVQHVTAKKKKGTGAQIKKVGSTYHAAAFALARQFFLAAFFGLLIFLEREKGFPNGLFPA